MAMLINSTTWRSPNYGSRNGVPITTLVIHSCEGRLPAPRESSLPWLCNPVSKVSAHYYLCRDASIFQLVDDTHEAWHAGGLQDDGTWTAQLAYSNPHSIGIECEHRSGQGWPATQKDALAWLVTLLMARYQIPPANVETHGQIAIKGPYDRKHDPSDWPHADFVSWRNSLTTPRPILHTVTAGPAGAIAQEDRRPGALAAKYYPPTTPIVCDDLTNSYWHVAAGDGFIPNGQVQA